MQTEDANPEFGPDINVPLKWPIDINNFTDKPPAPPFVKGVRYNGSSRIFDPPEGDIPSALLPELIE